MAEFDPTGAVVRVGEGRGFVIPGHFVATAEHCLPPRAPLHAESYPREWTYEKLLGPLAAEPTVWARCLFADPIADIAVLGPPDDQYLPEQFSDYQSFMYDIEPLSVDRASGWDAARVLSLDGQWLTVAVSRYNGMLAIEKGIVGGMSGSPIISDGRAIAVVSTDLANPILAEALPVRILRRSRLGRPSGH